MSIYSFSIYYGAIQCVCGGAREMPDACGACVVLAGVYEAVCCPLF